MASLVPLPVPPVVPRLAPLLDRRLLILSGKGGVGRTTVAAALARAAAARGKRVLIAQTDAVERLGKMLGRPGPIGPVVSDVAPGIAAVNMTPKESLHQYALMVLRYETVYRALFDNRVVRGFLSAIPGLDAYAMLGKAWWHTTEETKGAGLGGRRWTYDLVILDGPASGHATAMLKIPRAILEAVPAGPLARDARIMSELLSDPVRTALVIVTRPEELPASETVELAATARDTLKIPLGPVIVNAVPAGRVNAEPVSSALDRLRGIDDERLGRTVALATGQRAQRRTAEAVLTSLEKNPGLPLVTLPWLPSTALGLAEIDRLASGLAASPAIVGQGPAASPA